MKEVIMQVQSFSADYPKAPTYVGDLVRCKDCRHWDKKDRYCTDGGGLIIGVTENDFCSRGERSEE